jgi:predicted dehydrogenase
MATNLTAEQQQKGQENFQAAVNQLGLNRRDLLKAGVLGLGALGAAGVATYFGYQSIQGSAVKAALIGGGDEGGVLVGEHNPEFLKFVACCDVRPSNIKRIYDGDPEVALRKGFKKIYGSQCDKKSHPDYIEHFHDFEEMLKKRSDIEAVVIAVPLHLHAKVAIRAMQIGKERGKPIHVLTEKLMAWNITQCKQMIKVAKQTGSILTVGHQRHYNMVYAHALEVIKSGILGDIKHIRALWHRNFTWPWDSKHESDGKKMAGWMKDVPQPTVHDGWFPPIMPDDWNDENLKANVAKYGYDNLEQLIRWRLYAETGGGLMAELGSHQLDACSIFLGHVHPLTVSGTSTHCYFGNPGKNDGPNPRDIDDHVFVTYEFPGKNYFKRDDQGAIVRAKDGKPEIQDKNDIVVVTYSSVSTNGFEQYGECLMGSRGTMLVEREQDVMLFTEPKVPKDKAQKGDAKSLTVDVSTLKKDGAAAEASSTWGGPSAAQVGKGGGSAPASRGYREEMEDFAYCIRLWNAQKGYEKGADGKYVQRLPRCHGEVAMADAIVALTANQAMHGHKRIEFLDGWFDSTSTAVPDDPTHKPKAPIDDVTLG